MAEKVNTSDSDIAKSVVGTVEKNVDLALDLEFADEEGREPTDLEMKTLRHVSEKIPLSCWLVAIVELAERFSYYGLSTPFQNYMQNAPDDKPAGVLNLKNSGATALSYF